MKKQLITFLLCILCLPAFAQSVQPGAGGIFATVNATNAQSAYSINGVVVMSEPIDSGAGHSFALGAGTLTGQTSSAAYDNTAVGFNALHGTMTTAGIQNTALGSQAASSITSGAGNVAIGYQALATNNTGGSNTAVGYQALTGQSGIGNDTAIGYQACPQDSGFSNTCIGALTGTTNERGGSSNTLIGRGADVSTLGGSNEINIAGLIFYNVVSLSAPAVTACGTGSPAIDAHGNNRSGTLTAGGGVLSSCTITFAGGGYTTWNHCRVTFHNEVLAGAAYSYTTTVLTVTATSLTGATFDYDCDGY